MSLNETLRADGIPDNFKPEPVSENQVVGLKTIEVSHNENAFFCTDRLGSEKIAEAFRENNDCHDQIRQNSGVDIVSIVLIGASCLMAGFVIGHVTQ